MHVTKACATPSTYHIRRWLTDANRLCQEYWNSVRSRADRFCKRREVGFAALIRLFERLFHHGHAFLHALAQRAFDFLLAVAQREGLIRDIQRGEHRDLD